jgi:hypothetical protein
LGVQNTSQENPASKLINHEVEDKLSVLGKESNVSLRRWVKAESWAHQASYPTVIGDEAAGVQITTYFHLIEDHFTILLRGVALMNMNNCSYLSSLMVMLAKYKKA